MISALVPAITSNSATRCSTSVGDFEEAGVEAAQVARGENQCARAYAALGRAEPALHHANRCLDLVRAVPTVARPGTTYHYSNANYIVLGAMLIVLMVLRPNGLFGERRVEIV